LKDIQPSSTSHRLAMRTTQEVRVPEFRYLCGSWDDALHRRMLA
jgi:hypothetical protein